MHLSSFTIFPPNDFSKHLTKDMQERSLQLWVAPDGLGAGDGFLTGPADCGPGSDYLHRSGGLGRSRSHRWTHTGHAASAGEAGRTSTLAHWCTWNTEAGRLTRTRLGERERESLMSSRAPPSANSYTAQF